MADEKQAQETEQEQEPVQIQGVELIQEPAEKPQDKPAKKEKDSSGGLLLPVLYALLAAVGAFTLVMIAWIVWTFITRPAEPSESPSTGPSDHIIQTQAPEGGDSESSELDDAE